MHMKDKKFDEKKVENIKINDAFYKQMQENHKVVYETHEIDMDPQKLDKFQEEHNKFPRLRELHRELTH